MYNLGVFGGGAMGSAIVTGIVKAGLLPPERIFLIEPDSEKRDKLHSEIGVQIKEKPGDLTKECQTIILAVKPQVIIGLLEELNNNLDRDHLLISIAAGIPLSKLEAAALKARVIRVMPNTPARIGMGVSVFCPGQNTTGIDYEKTSALFGCIGTVLQLPEQLFDAVTAISGSGPAYVYAFINALIDAGVMLGLPRKDASILVAETVAGSVELFKQSGAHPCQLANEVTSPGGTTAAGLFELEKGAFAGTIMKAALAAAQRSKELSRI